MNIRKVSIAALSCFTLINISIAQPIININAEAEGVVASKDLYGIFFEEINHAGEGGIYPELIKNRGFEANRTPEDMNWNGDFLHSKMGWKHYYPKPDSLTGWNLQVNGDAKASMNQSAEMPLNVNNPMNLKVNILKAGSGNIEIENHGFWGISLIKDNIYNLSLYAHSINSYKGELAVILKSEKGEVLAKDIIKGIRADWKKFSLKLKPTATDAKAYLVIQPLSEGTLYLDMVSMFPEKTFKNRENGLRLDLATMIDEFKPGFIRFPGGCIVEGATLENRVKWKNTIGDVANRPGHWVLWDYYSTDGLGFHEYLQFCEDLGSPGMYVTSIGMSCQFRKREIVALTDLQPYIDETLDALEYALGPVTSKWGAERAKNGHPAPFNLKYVEIGNENYTQEYQERYNYFYKAIKAKYPQIITIACTDPGMRNPFVSADLKFISEPIEVIDEHFYESPDFFYKNAYRYDNYDRKGPQIYVGEYAVKKWENTLKGNLDAALAEAAFMTGFERNADIVKMSSQAPSFVNDNDRTWNPDLLVYNSSQAFGTPSYHVQKLFSNNIPDRVLPTEVANSGYKINPIEKGTAMIGFCNPAALCRYTDVKLTIGKSQYTDKELLINESLQAKKGGEWSVGRNEYQELKLKPEIYKLLETAGNNYTLTLKAYADSIDDLEAFMVFFHTTGWGKNYKWNIGRWNRYYWLQWYDNGYESYFGQAKGGVDRGKWYDIAIQVKGDSIFCSLDGNLIHAVQKPQMVTPGIYATSGINTDGSIVLKVVNPTDEEKTIPVNIKKNNISYSIVNEQIINGARLDENSFEVPLKVSAKTSTKSISGNSFTYKFAPRSVSVLTIKN